MTRWACRAILRWAIALAVCAGVIAAFALTEANVVTAPAVEGPLWGHVVAVDAGHGGYDGGARAPGGQWEKVYNLNIANHVAEYLASQGADVVMTRDGDYALCDINPKMRKKRQDMERRADLVLASGAEVLVSIHMNNFKDKRQSGPQVFYRPDCPAGVQFANTLQASMVDALSPSKKRDALAGDFYITSLGIPSALVECGFLSNPAEEALLRTDVYAKKVAKAIGDGIVAWFAMEEHPEAAERENR